MSLFGLDFFENLSKTKGMNKKVKGQANKTPMPHIVPKFDIGAILDVERAKKPMAVVNDVKNVGKILIFIAYKRAQRRLFFILDL